MNNVENICVVVMEECSEIQKAVSKSMRFGFDNYNPETPEKTNAYEILEEYYQLQSVMEMLIDNAIGNLSEEEISNIKNKKIVKVKEYCNLSKNLGKVE